MAHEGMSATLKQADEFFNSYLDGESTALALKRYVCRWIFQEVDAYGDSPNESHVKAFMNSIIEHGLMSGVGGFCYYHETDKQFEAFKHEINEVLFELVNMTGYNPLVNLPDKTDILCLESVNKQLIFYIAVEEIIQQVAQHLWPDEF